MKQIRKRLTYANVMASIAVFLVLGGAGALAASHHRRHKRSHVVVPKNSVGTKQLKRNAVTTLKIRPEAISRQKLRTGAVTSEKLAGNAVVASKIADGSVETSKIPDGAVTGGKLDPAERSEAHVFSTSSSFNLIDSYNPSIWTTAMSLNLPGGSWVVDANVSLEISSNVPSHVGCRMIQNGAVIAQGGTEGEREAESVPSYDGIALSALAGGGTVAVTCGDDREGTVALNRSLIAIRVGAVSG